VSSRRSALVALAVILGAAALLSAVSERAADATRPSAGTSSPSATGSASGSASATALAAVSLPQLSLQQLAGQRIIYSYKGLTPPASLIDRIKAGKVGGVIFFKANISSRTQIKGVIAKLQRAAAQSPVKEPLLMMTDQEGGLVRRLPGAPLLSEKQIGQSSDPATQATKAGNGAGLNLKGVGMNVNLAPVLGVYRRAGDFLDQYGRSYSMNPKVVARLGADFVKAQQAAGVAATAKHFPGLGAATAAQNTDLGPVTLNLSLSTIRSVDELPYPAAIKAGVRLVMVSWATYPALSRRPAGLATNWVKKELRGRLGFTGVTITDALGAGALRAYGDIPDRAVLAAHAGMDLLLCSGGSVREGSQAMNALATALGNGKLGATAFNKAVQRTLDLRASRAG
jgi:beta-N-acetylhexosaminidase